MGAAEQVWFMMDVSSQTRRVLMNRTPLLLVHYVWNDWVTVHLRPSSSVSNTTASTSSGSSDTGMSPSSASPAQNTVAVECRWWHAYMDPTDFTHLTQLWGLHAETLVSMWSWRQGEPLRLPSHLGRREGPHKEGPPTKLRTDFLLEEPAFCCTGAERAPHSTHTHTPPLPAGRQCFCPSFTIISTVVFASRVSNHQAHLNSNDHCPPFFNINWKV